MNTHSKTLTLTTSSTVWQVGALRLISTAITANSSTWIVAAAAVAAAAAGWWVPLCG
jgi:hypothetical protein